VISDGSGEQVDSAGQVIGRATNNVAEYRALVEGLRKAGELHVAELEVVSDSELVVHQMRGEWKIKKDTLRALWEEAQELAGRIESVRYTAVRREHNELADRLVNEALDAADS
jgi:probable phosphoglycerate mutase